MIFGSPQEVIAEPPSHEGSLAPAGPRTSTLRPESRVELAPHPLYSVLRDASEGQAFIRRTVRDFTCRLVKRERIDGILQDYTYIDMSVREEVRDGGRIVSPLSIYMEFLAPKNVAGRRVLYVEGDNEGKIRVRKGGENFAYVVTDVDPHGESAMRESLVPITDSGFNQDLTHLIEILKRHIAIDPQGENTQVQRIAGAKVNKRSCQVTRITHPKKQSGLEFHVANLFMDDELRVPLRVDKSGWPTRPNQEPPLIAEYTYTDLKLNVGLSDRTFDPRRLRGNR